MMRRRTLLFFGWFALFGALIAGIHLFLIYSAGLFKLSELSVIFTLFYFLCLVVFAFVLFRFSCVRHIPRSVRRHIPLKNVHMGS